MVKVLTPNEMIVRFTDYGNEQQTSRENLNPFHSSLSAFPVFGVKCALRGVGKNLQEVLGPFLLERLSMKVIVAHSDRA